MACYVEVVVPGPWWNSLTYSFDASPLPAEGSRVRVPVRTGERVGFVAARKEEAPAGLKIESIKPVKEVLDEGPVLGTELWNLAGWIGNTFLCGRGEALQLLCPKLLLQGEPAPLSFSETDTDTDTGIDNKAGGKSAFREISFYHPLDQERFAYYRERLSDGGRCLLLFSEAERAKDFFAGLPNALKAETLLWPSSSGNRGKKLWDAWKKTASGQVRAVVGAMGAVFAPLRFDEVVVEDESNPAYIFQAAPRISARSLAGRRAAFLGARLVLGGRMPSAKTYLRSRPECSILPPRESFVFVDMKRTLRAEARGVEGELPVTGSLLDRTRAVLKEGRHALWIMDRKGQAGEVYCSDCGGSLFCPRCGSIMRAENVSSGGNPGNSRLRCVRCAAREPMPAGCPACRGTLLLGKRPGLEALHSAALRFLKGYEVLLTPKKEALPQPEKPAPSLILGTRGILSLCDFLDVGLVGWLDLDAEARKVEYNARFQAFSMVWESYWRGLGQKGRSERTVLMQTRRPGSGWHNSFRLGWEHFWKGELRERKSLSLPPYTLLVQLDFPKHFSGVQSSSAGKDAVRLSLEKAEIFAMDAGGEDAPLWVEAKSTECLAEALASRFEIRHSREKFPVVTVWTE